MTEDQKGPLRESSLKVQGPSDTTSGFRRERFIVPGGVSGRRRRVDRGGLGLFEQ